jgi:hypothetical protein
MNPAYVVLALFITALLAWSWAEAGDIAADVDEPAADGHGLADPATGEDPEGAPRDGGGERTATAFDVWLLRVVLLAVDAAVWLGLALVPLP